MNNSFVWAQSHHQSLLKLPMAPCQASFSWKPPTAVLAPRSKGIQRKLQLLAPLKISWGLRQTEGCCHLCLGAFQPQLPCSLPIFSSLCSMFSAVKLQHGFLVHTLINTCSSMETTCWSKEKGKCSSFDPDGEHQKERKGTWSILESDGLHAIPPLVSCSHCWTDPGLSRTQFRMGGPHCPCQSQLVWRADGAGLQ